MKIYNIKLNSTNIIKIIMVVAIIASIIFFTLSSIKIFSASNVFQTNDEIEPGEIYSISTENYTNVLKSVHDNVDEYVGQKIEYTGYIYRVPDIEQDNFILARDMIISSSLQTLVVGFLCQYDEATAFSDRSWVHIVGTITKGDYGGGIPVIEIESMKNTEKPTDEYVYPPDSSYVETSVLL